MMPKIYISPCLLGHKTRYDGRVCKPSHSLIAKINKSGQVYPCPEVTGGLTVPRLPAEIIGGDGNDVLNGNAKIHAINGDDVTHAFLNGAYAVYNLVKGNQIRYAILKDGSPSCGSSYIYDGTFSGTRKKGRGVLAALLIRAGLEVKSEKALDFLPFASDAPEENQSSY